ncbi:Uncharacterised protein [uncultured archaeon]|nr:Uncharacterised protein [uncultured archaeon]
MAYSISTTSGNVLTTIPDTQVVNTYAGLSLPGKYFPGYGTILNSNFVHITENFASSTAPVNPLTGQVWFDTTANNINFWDGNEWKSISVVTSSDTAPLNAEIGDEWYDEINQQLYIWNGTSWLLIGPVSKNSEKEGFVVGTFSEGTGNIYYLQLYVNNELAGVVSPVNIDNPGINGFGNLRVGWNFPVNPDSAPTVIETGIYNVSEITVGDSDQLGFIIDPYDNGTIQINDGNVLVAVNGNSASNNYAYAEYTNGNIEGIIYANTIVASTFMGLPSSVIPGSSSQIIYNNAGILEGANALTVISGNVTARLNHLFVSSDGTISGTTSLGSTTVNGTETITGAATLENTATISGATTINNTLSTTGNISTSAGITTTGSVTVGASENISGSLAVAGSETIGGTLAVTGNVTGNLNLTNALNASIVDAKTYLNIPTVTVPGSNAEVIFNNNGSFGATPDLTVGAGGIIILTALSVSTTAVVSGELNAETIISSSTTQSIGNLSTNANLSVAKNAAVAGVLDVTGSTYINGALILNNGASGMFNMPTTHGTVNGGALLTNASGSTSWGTANLLSYGNYSFNTPGWQKLPSGLIIEWGAGVTIGSDTTLSIDFPLIFPTNCLSVIACCAGDRVTGGNPQPVAANPVNNTYFEAIAGGSDCEINWIAIGF